MRKSDNRRWGVLICSLLCLLVLSSFSSFAQEAGKDAEAEQALLSYRSEVDGIKNKKYDLSKRISLARKKELLALKKLQRTQIELDRAQMSYKYKRNQLSELQGKLGDIESQIVRSREEIKEGGMLLRDHLRIVYVRKASLLSALMDSLLNSENLVDFFNNFYYQRRLVKEEMALISDMRKKQESLFGLKESLQGQREKLSVAVKESRELKEQVFDKTKEQNDLVRRLRQERLAYEAAERQLERESNLLTNKIVKLTEGGSLDLSDIVNKHYTYPCSAVITSPFGYRSHPVFRVRSFHSGVDFGAGYGTPIKAANGGIVIYSGWYSGYGKTVIISHGNQESTLYAHMSEIGVSKGDKVVQGNAIGKIGSTGISTGPHLHFEFRKNGKPMNPMSVL